MSRRRRAAIAITSPDHEEKHLRLLLDYATEHHLDVVSFTRDATAAVGAVEAGHADMVLAAHSDSMRVLQRTTVPVTFLREPRHQDPNRRLILDMIARGGTVEVVAQLLDMPRAAVQAIADGHQVVHPRYAPERQVHVIRRTGRAR